MKTTLFTTFVTAWIALIGHLRCAHVISCTKMGSFCFFFHLAFKLIENYSPDPDSRSCTPLSQIAILLKRGTTGNERKYELKLRIVRIILKITNSANNSKIGQC